jgi:hypothetical protein
MTTGERMSRPTPERDAPNRGVPADPAVHEVVAHAVRVGYEVIGDNIRQGKTAADRITAGDYAVKDLPDELTQLSLRLLQLTRDMSATTFDLIGAVLRDPNLQSAIKGLTPSLTPASASPAPKPTAGSTIPLTCVIRGNPNAVGMPTTLAHPETASSLSIAGLFSPNPALPPLKAIRFMPAPSGDGIVAVVTVPDDQPVGRYSGLVCDATTHRDLGTLTVQVMP